MIRPIAREVLPSEEAASGHRLADPDLLIELAGAIARAPSDDALSNQFSQILRDLRMGGTWKRTSRGRLPITEQMICAHIVTNNGDKITVLDLGASDGITTLDLIAALRAKFGDRIRAVAADINLALLRYRKGPLVEYRAADGEPIMVRVGRFGMRLAGARREDGGASDRLGALYLRCALLRNSLQLDRRISLVHPLVADEPAIATKELDCLVRDPALTDQFTCVRASNVLNIAYFSPTDLRAAVRNVHAYLREDGCFIVSRNHDGPTGESENGSIWRKVGTRLDHVRDFGAGSEIKEVVDGCPPF